MRGAIIYFSGTGNTEFVSKVYQRKFKDKGIECALIDISKKKNFDDNYDFLVFGSAIHCEVFPDIFTSWVKNNIPDGKGRKCIVFSTQAAEKAAGADILSKILIKNGFNVIVKDFIVMPNNYYVTAFKEPAVEEIISLKKEAEKVISKHVELFLNSKSSIKKVSDFRSGFGKVVYKAFYKVTRKWAKKRFSVDNNLCVKCGKCVKNCPTHNINIKEGISFNNKCISCQKCLHLCPTNAFLYKGKHFTQYKL